MKTFNKYNIKSKQQKLKEKRKNGEEKWLNSADYYKTLVEIIQMLRKIFKFIPCGTLRNADIRDVVLFQLLESMFL